MSGRKRLRLIRLIRKIEESIRIFQGHFGLGLIYVILIKKNGVVNNKKILVPSSSMNTRWKLPNLLKVSNKSRSAFKTHKRLKGTIFSKMLHHRHLIGF